MKRLKVALFVFWIGCFFSANFARSADLTLDISYYYYEEPNFMDDTSNPVLYSAGSRKWDVSDNPDDAWQFLYTTEATRGWVNYSGSGTYYVEYIVTNSDNCSSTALVEAFCLPLEV